jgi:2-hydroxy-6-oxonona-2,4-dienedioate hydrolase
MADCNSAALPATPADLVRLAQQTRRIETPCAGGTMVWRCWGQGRPVVLLHGGAGSWMHWVRNVAPAVAAGRMVCVPDLPGFGESAACGTDVDDMLEPLAVGLEALLGHGPHDVVAFSLGTLVAVLLARGRPDLPGRLMLVAPLVLPLAPRAGVALKPWRGLPSPQARAAVHRANLAALMIHETSAIDSLAVHVQQCSAERDRLPRRRLSNTGAFADNFKLTQCSMSVVFGHEDVLFRHRWDEVLPVLERHPRVAEVVRVPGAGHWVQYERADTFNGLLASWLLGRRASFPLHPPSPVGA